MENRVAALKKQGEVVREEQNSLVHYFCCSTPHYFSTKVFIFLVKGWSFGRARSKEACFVWVRNHGCLSPSFLPLAFDPSLQGFKGRAKSNAADIVFVSKHIEPNLGVWVVSQNLARYCSFLHFRIVAPTVNRAFCFAKERGTRKPTKGWPPSLTLRRRKTVPRHPQWQ